MNWTGPDIANFDENNKSKSLEITTPNLFELEYEKSACFATMVTQCAIYDLQR